MVSPLGSCLRRSTAFGVGLSLGSVASAAGTPYATLKSLDAELRAADSATAVLQSLCARNHLADPPRIRAEQDRIASAAITTRQRRRLAIGPDEPVVYRRVKLLCGDHLLSQAENWYVPSRLTPDMNAALTTTDMPFGTAIRPLAPSRRHLSTQWLWRGRGVAPAQLLRHRALVLDGAGRPLAEVVETYQRDTIAP